MIRGRLFEKQCRQFVGNVRRFESVRSIVSNREGPISLDLDVDVLFACLRLFQNFGAEEDLAHRPQVILNIQGRRSDLFQVFRRSGLSYRH